MAGLTPLPGGNRAPGPGARRWSLAAGRLGVFAALWWVLTAGDVDSWRVGVPGVLLAVLSSRPRRRGRIRLLGLAAFVPFFLWRSLVASVDVAWRALHPRMPIDPDLLDYRLRVPDGPGRLLFASAINLLPGTVSAEIEGDRLRVHVIDRGQPQDALLEDLELRVAAILEAAPGGPG